MQIKTTVCASCKELYSFLMLFPEVRQKTIVRCKNWVLTDSKCICCPSLETVLSDTALPEIGFTKRVAALPTLRLFLIRKVLLAVNLSCLFEKFVYAGTVTCQVAREAILAEIQCLS